MVYRVYVEKKKELALEANGLLNEAKNLLGITNLTNVRVFNRYDAENITEDLFNYAIGTVFSEPQLDIVTSEININDATVFAVEYLPGQFDQRADSAAQCIQIISQGERPVIRSAKVYALYGILPSKILKILKNMLSTLLKRVRQHSKSLKHWLQNMIYLQLLKPLTDFYRLTVKVLKSLYKIWVLLWMPMILHSARTTLNQRAESLPLPKSV